MSSLKEKIMFKRSCLLSLALGLLYSSGVAQYPMLDMVANKVIQKYQATSCEQLSQQRSQPKSPEEQKVIQLLRSDPQMRTEFLNKVAAPIANKMFDCGVIP